MNKIITTGDKWFYLKTVLDQLRVKGGKEPSLNIGSDNGYIDGWKYWRNWTLIVRNDEQYLVERKSSPASADYSRLYKLHLPESDRVSFEEMHGGTWTH